MKSENFEKYNNRRNALISKYKKEKRVNVLTVLGVGAALLILVVLLRNLLNIAVTLLLSAISIMITVIFARIRYVTINYVMEQKLRDLESEDPNFY